AIPPLRRLEPPLGPAVSSPSFTAAPMPETATHPGPTWRELCEDPRYAFLRDAPFKVETNRWGQIVMSPTYQRHGYFQARIVQLLGQLLPHGTALVECAIRTSDGVKEADAAWYTAQRWEQAKD